MTYKLHDTLSIFENENGTTLVTTAIDYPNNSPHIGTAFEKIGADVYVRFRRFQGREVYFLMGNDENTIKVVKRAKELGKPIKQYVDEMAEQFKQVWKDLNISFDDFIQTSEERHTIGVQQFLSAVYEAGYIEKRPYKGTYCEGCEEYKTDGTCPNHPGKLEEREEENYFFLLSKFKRKVSDMLVAAYEIPFFARSLSCEPESRYKEMKNFVQEELTDISISRRNEGWGIPIPWDNTHVTYVWFDALLNYLTGIGFGSDWDKFYKFWPAEVHFIGKDITRFHCALFPAMCLAYQEGCDKTAKDKKYHDLHAYPHRVFAHGFIYERKGDEIVKSSKSGTAVNPADLIEQFGTDAYRYYFMSRCNYTADGEYSLDHFKDVYNSDLANNLGNLVSRVVSMIQKYFDGTVHPYPIPDNDGHYAKDMLVKYEKAIVQNLDYRSALEIVTELVNGANLFIEVNKPWAVFKTDLEKLKVIMSNLVVDLRTISLLLVPFMPETARKIYEMFTWQQKWEDISWSTLQELVSKPHTGMDGLTINSAVMKDGKLTPLFPRI
jgi:methionyl-tRNA synthetase